MNNICVFSGSSCGKDDHYREAAVVLGRIIAEKGYGLVYGGGNIGLMGCCARAALKAGAPVTGVIPEYIYRKVDKLEITNIHVVPGMHERKAKMYELSDMFIALPGGIGTLEEVIEIYTWGQLGFHAKPVGLLNISHYYDPLMGFLEHAVEQGFLKKAHYDNLIMDSEPGTLLGEMLDTTPVHEDKWR